jgi:hypothetical protein
LLVEKLTARGLLKVVCDTDTLSIVFHSGMKNSRRLWNREQGGEIFLSVKSLESQRAG